MDRTVDTTGTARPVSYKTDPSFTPAAGYPSGEGAYDTTGYDQTGHKKGFLEKVKEKIPGTQEHKLKKETEALGGEYGTGYGTGYSTGTGYTDTAIGATGVQEPLGTTGTTYTDTAYTGTDTGYTGTGAGYTGTGAGYTGTAAGVGATGVGMGVAGYEGDVRRDVDVMQPQVQTFREGDTEVTQRVEKMTVTEEREIPREREELTCGAQTFTEVEDRAVVRERVIREVEHRPVEKEFEVITRPVGERELMEGRGTEVLSAEERIVSENVGSACPTGMTGTGYGTTGVGGQKKSLVDKIEGMIPGTNEHRAKMEAQGKTDRLADRLDNVERKIPGTDEKAAAQGRYDKVEDPYTRI